MINVPNSSPEIVSFKQTVTGDEALIAAKQIAKASHDETVARAEVENANYRLVKATENLKEAEIAYFSAIEKSAWNREELRKSYNNALAGFRDADRKATETAENLSLASAVLAGLNGIAKREFSGEKRQALAEEGKAMPDGSYPIVNAGDLKNAVASYGRAKDPEAVKAHIIARADDLGLTDSLPEGWVVPTAKRKATIMEEIEKGAVMVLCPHCLGGLDGSIGDCTNCNDDGMASYSVLRAFNKAVGGNAFSTDALLTRDFEKSAGFQTYIFSKYGVAGRSGDLPGHEFHGNQYQAGVDHRGETPEAKTKRYDAAGISHRDAGHASMKAGDRASVAGNHAEAAQHYREAAKSYIKAQGTQKGNEMTHREQADAGNTRFSHTEANMYQENARALRTMATGASAKADASERASASGL